MAGQSASVVVKYDATLLSLAVAPEIGMSRLNVAVFALSIVSTSEPQIMIEIVTSLKPTAPPFVEALILKFTGIVRTVPS